MGYYIIERGRIQVRDCLRCGYFKINRLFFLNIVIEFSFKLEVNGLWQATEI